MKTYILLTIAMVGSSLLMAQSESVCNCEQHFNQLIQKLEANYIAYHLTKNEIHKDYEAQKQKYGALVKNTDLPNCTKTLQAFLDFFKDGHLFVTEIPNLPEETLTKYKKYIKDHIIDVNKSSPGKKTSIEGYWTDGESKFMIIKNPVAKVPYEYVAVILDAEDKSKIGEIKFGVSRSNSKWEGIYYTNSYAPRYVSIDTYRDHTLMSIWGGIFWGRLENQNAPLYLPTSPLIQAIDNQTATLTIPSFLIEKRDFDSILNKNENLLSNIENLIIDIRGNTGGNGIYFNLLRYYYEKPGVSGRGWAIASDDNMAYFQRFARDNPNDPYAPVVADMKLEKGKIVKGPIFQPLILEAKPNKIKKVIILTDRGNMSAAETFILYSKGVSNKVITMGDNTGGVVDYNNVNMIPLDCKTQGIYFGYPTYTLHDKIPKEGYNKTGIVPDIKINNKVKDKIGYVVKYLKKHG